MNRVCAALTSVVVFAMSMFANVSAEEVDYSYLKDMSVEELKELDAEIQKLLGDEKGVTTDGTVSGIESVTDAVLCTEADFFNDVLAAYSARQKVPGTPSFQENANFDIVKYDRSFVEQEVPFADQYRKAIFENIDIQYLCRKYVNGVYMQLNACDVYEQSERKEEDFARFEQIWKEGYIERCYSIVELAEKYNLGFPASSVASMKSQLEKSSEVVADGNVYMQAPRETVQEVQKLLNDIGLKCGSADGIAGKRTIEAVRKFLEMYAAGTDGKVESECTIDDQLVSLLQQAKEERDILIKVE